MSDSENKGITAFCSILLPERFGIFEKTPCTFGTHLRDSPESPPPSVKNFLKVSSGFIKLLIVYHPTLV